MTRERWQDISKALSSLLGVLVAEPGIAIGVATKVLHLKRPELVPICDSVVMGRLISCANSTKSVARAMKCIEKFRDIGMQEGNRAVLKTAQGFLREKLPPGNAHREMSLVKILDSVLWFDTSERLPYFDLLGWKS